MPADNVDIFKRIIFHIPSSRINAAAITILGAIYGGLFYVALKLFAGNLFDTSILGIEWIAGLSLLFIAPALLSGELLHLFLPDYPRKWGYFLSMSNQLIFFTSALILSGGNNFINTWNILWLGVVAVYLSNFFVLLLTLGDTYWKRIGVLSLAQPLAILAGFHMLLGQYLRIPLQLYVSNLALLPFAGVLLLGIFAISEYLMKSNVASDFSVLDLTSALLQKHQETLDLGYPTEVDVQTLEVANESEEATLAVPWVHPGPLEGFGGGRLTSNIIDSLNQKGEGFFLHVPSTHKSDPSNPEDYKKILDALSDPETTGKASKMLEKNYGDLTLYGRRIGDKKIVFMETDEFDDFELPVFREIIDPDEVLLIDLHNHERNSETDGELWYNTSEATKYRQHLIDFLNELGEQELHDYSAGFRADNSGKPVFALVEEAGGEETLLFGIEGNEASRELLDLEQNYSEEFDRAKIFTTDTHQSIHQLSSKKQIEPGRVKETVEKARERVSPAEIGFGNRKTEEMNLLQEDYQSMVFSINILVRLIPLSLLFIYISLAIWVF